MTAPLTTQLREYFDYVDDQQVAVDVDALIRQLSEERSAAIHRPDRRRRWPVAVAVGAVAAVILAVVLLTSLRDDAGPVIVDQLPEPDIQEEEEEDRAPSNIEPDDLDSAPIPVEPTLLDVVPTTAAAPEGSGPSLFGWGDGFLAIDHTITTPPPELTEEERALFSAEVLALLDDPAVDSLETALLMATTAGLFDDIGAVLDANRELREKFQFLGPESAAAFAASVTTEGEEWQPIEGASWPVLLHDELKSNGDHLVLASRPDESGRIEVFATTDVVTWTGWELPPAEEAWPASLELAPDGWALILDDRTVWTATWEGELTQRPPVPGEPDPTTMAQTADGMVVERSTDPGVEPGTRFVHSSDWTTWTEVGPPAPGWAQFLVRMGDGVLVSLFTGGSDEDAPLWLSSSDGAEWTAVLPPRVEGRAVRMNYAVHGSEHGAVFVAFPDVETSAPALLFATEDGRSWLVDEVPLDPTEQLREGDAVINNGTLLVSLPGELRRYDLG